MDCKIYPLSKDEQIQLEEFLKENLETNRIRPSKSPMASPLLEDGERLLAVHLGSEEVNIRTKTTYSTEIASAKKDT